MKITWMVTERDIEKVRSFLAQYSSDPLVRGRALKNLAKTKPRPSKGEFWQATVSCLLTTQQRSGPDSAVTRFISTKPFPLNYQVCIAQSDLATFAQEILGCFGGLRRTNRIADEVATNLSRLEGGLWRMTFETLDTLRQATDVQIERRAAEFISDNFKGFGPKQSRNLLQNLALTRYEIPIDSRITKWLNAFGFPVRLSASALSDRNYYNFVSEGIQKLCAASEVHPCILDAAIFTSFDQGGWTEETAIW